jgi:hypothetical protein
MCDEQEQQGRPNQLFFRGNHLDWPSQPNRRPPGTPIWPNLARVIDLQEFMGRRPSHPPRAVAGPCRCQLFVGRSRGKSARGGCRLMGSRLPPRTSPDWALLGANFRRSWCDLEPRAWIGISCNGCCAMAQAKLARGERRQCLAAPAARGVLRRDPAGSRKAPRAGSEPRGRRVTFMGVGASGLVSGHVSSRNP